MPDNRNENSPAYNAILAGVKAGVEYYTSHENSTKNPKDEKTPSKPAAEPDSESKTEEPISRTKYVLSVIGVFTIMVIAPLSLMGMAYETYKYDQSPAGKAEYQAHLERQKAIQEAEKQNGTKGNNISGVAGAIGLNLLINGLAELAE